MAPYSVWTLLSEEVDKKKIAGFTPTVSFGSGARIRPRFAFMWPSRNKPDGNMLREDSFYLRKLDKIETVG
jgi:hypothetical protein